MRLRFGRSDPSLTADDFKRSKPLLLRFGRADNSGVTITDDEKEETKELLNRIANGDTALINDESAKQRAHVLRERFGRVVDDQGGDNEREVR